MIAGVVTTKDVLLHSAAIVLDLSSAGPIRGKALAVVARVFAAGSSGAGARVWRRPRGIARALLQGGAVAARAGPRRPPSPSSVEQAVPRGGVRQCGCVMPSRPAAHTWS